jgi:hypothetical protein
VLRWELTSLRMWLPLVTVVQILAGAGFVLGIGLFFRHIPGSVALFFSTGVPVINIILVGLILGPQLVADQKVTQGYGFGMALAIPNPMITNLVTNALVFLVLLFSPIVFPPQTCQHGSSPHTASCPSTT